MAAKNTISQLGVDIEELKEMVQDTEVDTPVTAPVNDEETVEATGTVTEPPAAPVERQPHERSHKYKEARSHIDRTKEYPLEQAVELVKRTSYSSFDGTVSAHINLKRELKQIEVTFPHSTGKELRVAIANDELLQQLENGELNFDILIAEPKMMPKLAKYARTLGPKGLMPNPKTGTVTTDPEAKKKALESGAMVVRPEKKAPLLHVRVGKVSQSIDELRENVEALLRAVNPLNIEKVTLAATMSPGIKVKVE